MNRDVQAFLRSVHVSGLLKKQDIHKAFQSCPPESRDNADLLAEHFIKTGKLSRYQSAKLLQGVTLGLVLGPFQVLAPLGRGGMGAVYLARDGRSDKLVALKVLPPKRAREEERILARFRREMALSQLLTHPHIAQSYETGVEHEVYYIAMEYIPGTSLFRQIMERGPLHPGRAARLFLEVVEGLAFAHSQGLIHRDLKPSNIMITPNDHAKVLDLGLAIIQGETLPDRQIVGGAGLVVGTMDYLSPEQARDSTKVDPRTDIYSLGCTFYFALTGRPPFPGGEILEKIHRHKTHEPALVMQLNPDVPPAFAGLVHRMMAKNAKHRPNSMEDIKAELQTFMIDEPVLPLDQKTDRTYRQAVEELENSQFTEEQLQANIIEVEIEDEEEIEEDDETSMWHNLALWWKDLPVWVQVGFVFLIFLALTSIVFMVIVLAKIGLERLR